ncbi:hypothetical protein ACFX2I_039633 [Malus domestica]
MIPICYLFIGVGKFGRNAEGDSWWETWQEVLHQDEWRWEKYDAKGWTEKGAHKYGRLNEQSWTDKWAETELGTKWGDKWEEKFFARIGSRQGETWHVGQGHGEKSTLEMVRCTNMGKARLGKAGILLWTRRPITNVVGDSSQLLSIKPRERPPGVYPALDFGSLSPPVDEPPDEFSPQ